MRLLVPLVGVLLLATTALGQQLSPVQIPFGRSGEPAAGRPLPLEGVWQWQHSRRADGSSTTPEDSSQYTIEFLVGGRFTARADCNQVLGTYSVSGTQLTLEPGAMTRVACPPGSFADEFVANLAAATTHALTGTHLVLGLASASGEMTFVPLVPAELVGATWQAQAYNNGRGGLQSIEADTAMTAIFDADAVSGSSGCNQYNGRYTRSGDQLSIGPLASTRMLCEQHIMQQEAAYLAALEATTTLSIRGTELKLSSANGETQATFVVSIE